MLSNVHYHREHCDSWSNDLHGAQHDVDESAPLVLHRTFHSLQEGQHLGGRVKLLTELHGHQDRHQHSQEGLVDIEWLEIVKTHILIGEGCGYHDLE